jgi:N-acetyl-gamma-glutamyl-phosphate reductase
MKVSVIGATGYAGEELLRILAGHPAAEVVAITSESQTGENIENIYPHFTRFYSKKLACLKDLPAIAAASDAVFIALPHGHAMEAGKQIVAHGAKVIDMGADYRFRDPAVYEKWYKVPHTHADSGAVYGLTELYRDEVRAAAIVGNPGCYTTVSILALAPLLKHGLVDPATIIVDAKSGISGAGRSLGLNYHLSEAYENVKAYGIAGHRHTPEIEQALSDVAGQEVVISFTPHLIPMARGILSTCYATLKAGVTPEAVDAAYAGMYGGEHFIRLRGRGGYPATKETRGSNFCDIGWHLDPRTGRVVAVGAIDNLVKGAAGQAVQNLNAMFGLDERAGLTQAPLYP